MRYPLTLSELDGRLWAARLVGEDTTQQINRAYAVLGASHFQGFVRDLHTESVDYLVAIIVVVHSMRLSAIVPSFV